MSSEKYLKERPKSTAMLRAPGSLRSVAYVTSRSSASVSMVRARSAASLVVGAEAGGALRWPAPVPPRDGGASAPDRIMPPDDEPAATLTAALAATCSTALGSTDGGATFGFTRLHAFEKNLSRIAHGALDALTCVTFVDLSGNQLTSLAALGCLPALSTLTAPQNRLTEALDWQAPATGSRLRQVDLRDNVITALSRHTASHCRLEMLQLDGNQLTSLGGLVALSALQTLSAASNQLRDATPTARLAQLRALTLRANELDDAGVASLPAGLAQLDVAENRLSDLRALLRTLGGARRLHTLQLLPGNALEVELAHGVHGHAVVTWGFDDVQPAVGIAYRARVAEALPWLSVLDGAAAEEPAVARVLRSRSAGGEGSAGGDSPGARSCVDQMSNN